MMHTHELTSLIRRFKDEHTLDALVTSLADAHSLNESAPFMKDAALQSGVPLYCIIGGCEAYRDIYDALSIGVDAIVAPMIDSAYALDKFGDALKAVGNREKGLVSAYATLSSLETIGSASQIIVSKGKSIIDGVIIDCDECALSVGAWNESCLRAVRSAIESSRTATLPVTLRFSRLYSGIDSLIQLKGVESLSSGNMLMRNSKTCLTGLGCFLEKAAELENAICRILSQRMKSLHSGLKNYTDAGAF